MEVWGIPEEVRLIRVWRRLLEESLFKEEVRITEVGVVRVEALLRRWGGTYFAVVVGAVWTVGRP